MKRKGMLDAEGKNRHPEQSLKDQTKKVCTHLKAISRHIIREGRGDE